MAAAVVDSAVSAAAVSVALVAAVDRELVAPVPTRLVLVHLPAPLQLPVPAERPVPARQPVQVVASVDSAVAPAPKHLLNRRSFSAEMGLSSLPPGIPRWLPVPRSR